MSRPEPLAVDDATRGEDLVPGQGHGFPETRDSAVFAEPWQAQAFAMTVALHERGLFTWGEWAQALSAEVKAPGAAPDGSDYYDCWLRALERLLSERQVAPPAEVDALAAAWERAAHATPHGQPIRLENDPQGSNHPA